MDAQFDSKPVIVIDESQYIGKSNPAFPSVFQRIWEEILKNRSVMVILCGSLISMMESQTLAYGSPLYGRRTAQIRLKQIPFGYYHEFFPGKSRRELIEMYAVTGGKVNPLIGSAGVSAVPMAARVSQKVGQSENPANFLLMHAMGPNVAGVIGSAVAAGVLLTLFG